ncbi:MAG: hypothetical protein FKY71_08620 [Spiribacter salinus]|uniref:Uncharacterized protein n=1 Tax=Spiribacter salinus TaxID=1335746 RepID=A0A540VRN7_9GAMM|nr:MAG: hypothetical protein FKY71_08620 [Spiribacter salinus]
MLSNLKFVQGAVSTKDYIPELKHFTIVGGNVTGFNGVVALNSPVDFDIDCAPKAAPLVKAIDGCTETVSLKLTDANRLRVQSGPFKVFVDCVDLEEVPRQAPEGEELDVDGEALMEAIPKLKPFIGNDASRPWSNGIMLKGHSAFATNNVCLVEHWLGAAIPRVLNIPLQAITEMLRIGEAPSSVQASGNSITFHYTGGRWLRSQLYSTEWPELSKILDRATGELQPVPPEFFEGLAMVKPFLEPDGLVHMRDGVMYTTADDNLGASFNVPSVQTNGIYVHKMMTLLGPVATKMDFDAYPKPLCFQGDKLRGVVLGRRP